MFVSFSSDRHFPFSIFSCHANSRNNIIHRHDAKIVGALILFHIILFIFPPSHTLTSSAAYLSMLNAHGNSISSVFGLSIFIVFFFCLKTFQHFATALLLCRRCTAYTSYNIYYLFGRRFPSRAIFITNWSLRSDISANWLL